jgi:hypothetical protein
MKEQAHGMLDQLSNRQLEAVLGLLRCFTGYDESEDVPVAMRVRACPPPISSANSSPENFPGRRHSFAERIIFAS